MERSLKDASATVLIVTNPAELPTSETVESLKVLRTERLGPEPIVIMNRVLAESGIDPDRVDELPEGAVRDAASLQTGLEAEQKVWLESVPYIASLPYLAGVFTPQEVSLQLSDEMEAII